MPVFWILPRIQYPLTQDFPSAMFNKVAYVGALLSVIILTIVNAAVVGYEPIVVFSDEFNYTQSLWFHKFIPDPKPGTLCEPRILNVGDSFLTNASIYEWKIMAIAHPSTKKSGLAYYGTTLDNCDIDQMNLYGELHTPSMELTANASCKCHDGATVVLETSLTFSTHPGRHGRYRYSAQHTSADPLGEYLGRMAYLARGDVASRARDAFPEDKRVHHDPLSLKAKVGFCPAVYGMKSKQPHPCAVDPPQFTMILSDSVNASTQSTYEGYSKCTSGSLTLCDFFHPISNLLHFYLALFRVDFGNQSFNNMFTHPEMLNCTLFAEFPNTTLVPKASSRLYAYLNEQSLLSRSNSKSAFDAFRIPGPSIVRTSYVCESLKRKSAASLFVSVFVATAGMFTSGWAIFIFIARYLYRKPELEDKLVEDCRCGAKRQDLGGGGWRDIEALTRSSYLADALGRQRVYGKELMLIIFATIMTLTTPTGQLSPDASLIYLGVWRIILGIGVGGDYPMSASVTSDRANIRKRGTMLTYIFSMQGWGSLMGSLIVIILLAIYKNVIDGEGKISKVDGVWRIAVGLSLVPAFGTLYQRLTLGEATRYEESKKLGSASASAGVASSSANDSEDEIIKLKELQRKQEAKDNGAQVDVESRPSSPTSEEGRNRDKKIEVDEVKKPAHFKDFLEHFGRWENAKLLFATSMSWFLLDIAFYGINLNQNVVLQQIGFDGSSGSPWHRLFRVSTGNIIITVLGFVPGYYATLFTIEILGRKWIQIQGFLLSALFLGILAGKFHTLSTVQFIVCFAFLQFFFNFGANTTTYCYPAEVFPTRYKAFAHGISAASGKAGAIISALAFNQLSKKIGTPACLWIFMGCCLAGAAVSLLLPEVRGRDADLILAQQIEERKREGRR
ncbi:hypothetical protein NMY22_g12371 [Coprinellus aureogranulatus]|nr:hypothetical protein NMY22_g12371 [Coprinellus aureogranulatus]